MVATSEAGELNGIVIRPSILYGRSGSNTADIFAEAERASKEGADLIWAGAPGGRWALIHVDDLADLFVRAAESVSSILYRHITSTAYIISYSRRQYASPW